MSILPDRRPPATSSRRRIVTTGALGVAAIAGPLALAFAVSSAATFRSELAIDGNRLETAEIAIDLGVAAATRQILNLAPGDVRTWNLEITNGGGSDMRYALETTSTSAALGAALQVSVHADGDCSATTLGGPVPMGATTPQRLLGSPSEGAQPGDRVLPAGSSERLCVRIALPRGTGNELQGLETRHTVTATAEAA